MRHVVARGNTTPDVVFFQDPGPRDRASSIAEVIMERRTILKAIAAVPAVVAGDMALGVNEQLPKLTAPRDGTINVAVLLSEGATIIDFCGPWEVFQDVAIGGSHSSPDHRMPFRLYTVAERQDAIRASGGMRIVPDYTLASAPKPQVVVIPAQGGRSEAMRSWIVKTHETADVTLSVCTGAFLLASTGLLKGKAATTHHDFFDQFASQFKDVELKRGLRFVEHGKLMTAGGLSSGIDAALRIVERYFGRETAQQTAAYMEYQGRGWVS
jgi:transcriptional regulator GlxA family with amidase domain